MHTATFRLTDEHVVLTPRRCRENDWRRVAGEQPQQQRSTIV